MGALVPIIWLGLMVLIVVGFWKMFEKAGEPGWASIVPIYNAVVMLRVAGKPAWWLILFFVPVVNFVVAILVASAIAENFGKSGGFAAGLVLLPFVFYPILGFGDAQYGGPRLNE